MDTPYLKTILKLFFLLFITSCNSDNDFHEDVPQKTEIVINARNTSDSLSRPLIYQALIPVGWTYKEPTYNESLTDTTKPIYTIIIDSIDEDDNIEITIHNFPLKTLDSRVPASAQVQRWKQQLGGDEVKNASVTPQSYGGFSGLRFEGEGFIDGKDQKMIGWIMQLSPEHYYSLSQQHEEISDEEAEQMRSDYTIKVVGPPSLVDANKEAIDNFARSFRFIKPVPAKR